MTWNGSNDNVGVTGYKIYRNNNYLSTVITGTSFDDNGLTAATQYSYAVSAIDAAGNESNRSSSMAATTEAIIVPAVCAAAIPTNAFSGCYYDNRDFTNLKLIRTDARLDFDWGGGSPDPFIECDTFSAVWQGTFTFEPAEYKFTFTADDGIRLYVDGDVILNKWIDQWPRMK